MADNFSSEAYIEPSVLEGWKSTMSSINNACLGELDNFKAHSAGLADSWRGDAADGYSQTFDNFIEVVKNKHESMKNLDSFISEVIITMESH
jgi:uncharacterized protein YukE